MTSVICIEYIFFCIKLPVTIHNPISFLFVFILIWLKFCKSLHLFVIEALQIMSHQLIELYVSLFLSLSLITHQSYARKCNIIKIWITHLICMKGFGFSHLRVKIWKKDICLRLYLFITYSNLWPFHLSFLLMSPKD